MRSAVGRPSLAVIPETPQDSITVRHGRPTGASTQMKMEQVAYRGWDNCLRLSDGVLELIVTTDVGPRVIHCGFVGGRNLFFENPEDMGKSGGPEWRIYGGHRFWHAPEAFPRTYAPDNLPVDYESSGPTLKLKQAPEEETGIGKELEVTLHAGLGRVTVLHRAVNENPWEIELAAWSPTAMAAAGRAIIPQEEYRPHPDYLLPARPLVLWHYTDMSDPRWVWGRRYIQLRQDPAAESKQKIGVLTSQGWLAYALDGDLFIKRFDYQAGADYPDFGCNAEVFTDAAMLELESLGPLTRLAANGGSVEHTEEWQLVRARPGIEESSIDAVRAIRTFCFSAREMLKQEE